MNGGIPQNIQGILASIKKMNLDEVRKIADAIIESIGLGRSVFEVEAANTLQQPTTGVQIEMLTQK